MRINSKKYNPTAKNSGKTNPTNPILPRTRKEKLHWPANLSGIAFIILLKLAKIEASKSPAQRFKQWTGATLPQLTQYLNSGTSNPHWSNTAKHKEQWILVKHSRNSANVRKCRASGGSKKNHCYPNYRRLTSYTFTKISQRREILGKDSQTFLKRCRKLWEREHRAGIVVKRTPTTQVHSKRVEVVRHYLTRICFCFFFLFFWSADIRFKKIQKLMELMKNVERRIQWVNDSSAERRFYW